VTKIIASFYKYLLLRKLTMPYFRTISFFSFIAILCNFLLETLFPIPDEFDPFGRNKLPILNYISGAIFFGVLYFVISTIFKKENLGKYSFTDSELKNSFRNTILFLVFLFFLIMTLSTLHVRDKIWGN
jgi:hypothetical protein